MDDPRFSHIASDPRFKRVPKKRHKVTIDNRFKSMFTDKKFTTNYHFDKRGKKIGTSSKEDLKKYYHLDESLNDKDNEEDSEASIDRDEASIDGDEEASIDGDEEASIDGDEEASIDGDEEASIDGDEEACFDDSSSDGGSSTDGEVELEQDVSFDWGDLTGDVERSDNVTHRLAVCNMNWDRITAQDLYVLFNSFKPKNGIIHSVKIYLSDYGKERLAKEETEGPAELLNSNVTQEPNPDQIEGEAFAREKLRQYQLNRLRYYYGIIECNDKATAEHIYDQCDGIEYENSASSIDVRFVPDDIEFDDKPHSEATESGIDYTPSMFVTSALQQTTVNLTWDETDPTRLKKTMASFSKDELENMDFGTYLASSSDDEDTEPRDNTVYRKLLGIDGAEGERDKDRSNDNDEELEISWNIGLEDKKEHKYKDKRKSLKSSKSSNKHQKKDEDNNTDDKGFDDPFFTDAPSSKKKKHSNLTSEEKEEKEQQKNELELLMMSDSEENKKHFSIKDMESEHKKESAKKKRKKRKLKADNDGDSNNPDSFTVDTDDPRFNALYESHLYAVDPTNPQYKQTKGMEDILTEKQKRSKARKVTSDVQVNADSSVKGLDPLVHSVKAKTKSFMERKKRKKQSAVIS